MADPIKDQWKVVQYGTDSSGRPIYMTWYHRRWFEGRAATLKAKGIRLVINQGGFMSRVSGGGAEASSGFHDMAGAIDLSTRHLNDTQCLQVIDELRWNGAMAWVRDMTAQKGMMPKHIHYGLGVDRPMDPGLRQQWENYKTGDAGTSGSTRDYHRRPSPLVLVPPTPPFAGNIAVGDHGPHVKAIQRGLGVKVTGWYDKETARLVRQWKYKRGIYPSSTITARAYWGITPK